MVGLCTVRSRAFHEVAKVVAGKSQTVFGWGFFVPRGHGAGFVSGESKPETNTKRTSSGLGSLLPSRAPLGVQKLCSSGSYALTEW